MLIEAFTEAKNPRTPEANEDAIVVLPGRAYAVIDGVSDRTGRRHDGMLAGRFAARLVARSLEALLAAAAAPDAMRIVRHLTGVIADAYRERGMLEQVADGAGRFAATLALVLADAEAVRILLVGDSGVRINGTGVRRLAKDLDRITATLRQCAWMRLEALGVEAARREALARRVTMHGAGQAAGEVGPELDARDLAAIGQEAVRRCACLLPHVPQDAIAELVRGGIVNGQGRHQNNTASVLGYSCLDGFDVPEGLMLVETLRRDEVRSVELFTDGYCVPGDAFGVAAWEAAFRRSEAEDPAKVRGHLGTRGSGAGLWSDDRSYLGVKL